MSKFNDTSRGTSTAVINSNAGLAGRYARYRIYRRTLAELSTLSVRERDDLGLGGASLRDVAYMAVSGS